MKSMTVQRYLQELIVATWLSFKSNIEYNLCLEIAKDLSDVLLIKLYRKVIATISFQSIETNALRSVPIKPSLGVQHVSWLEYLIVLILQVEEINLLQQLKTDINNLP